MRPRFRVGRFLENEGYPPRISRLLPYGFVRTEQGWHWYYRIE